MRLVKKFVSFAAAIVALPACVATLRAPTLEVRPVRVHVQAQAGTNRPPPPARATIQVSVPTLTAGVVVVQQQCNAANPEVVNGLDDNCNGEIDEGFGFASGQIQITLFWEGGADIDMHVTEPDGHEISYRDRGPSGTGGTLDHDFRGACTGEGGQPVENVFWNTPAPPNGDYQVDVNYFSNCTNAGPTTVRLSISVGGQIIGQYSYTLQTPRQRVTLARFKVGA